MRGTLHLVSARDYPLYTTALRKEVAPWSNGRAKPAPELVTAVRAHVRREPRAARELVAFLEERRGPAGEVDNLRDLAWLRHLIPLEPLPNTAEWGFTRGVRFRAASFRRPPVADALVHLVKRYLAAFGPATRADLASWSGQLLKTLDPALESIRLRRFADEEGRELIDLPRAPLADGDERAPIRFLSRWDELLIAHADRRRVLPEEHAMTEARARRRAGRARRRLRRRNVEERRQGASSSSRSRRSRSASDGSSVTRRSDSGHSSRDARPHAEGAQPGDACAATAAGAQAGLGGRGDRAPRRDAGSVAAGAVRRALVARLRVQARDARTRGPLGQRREGDGDARHPSPRDRARLPAVLRGAARGCGRGATRSRWSSAGSSCRRCGRSSPTGRSRSSR